MSVENLITQHIDIWTSAVQTKSTAGRGTSSRLDLYGIKKLRELILELAVRGKLVPQDPNDEPAEDLLKISLDAKELLIKDGVIPKPRTKKKIAEEHFYSYPASWTSSKLEDLINVINGRAYKKAEMLSAGTPILRVGNLFTSNEWYYSDLELEDNKYIDNGDLIYAWSASFGPFIWDGGRVIYHYHIWKMDIFSDSVLDKNFSRLFLQAISERIKASGNGIAMIHMTKERMEKVIHPLPPLEEQHRIVAKVDELMILCDQLEQQTEASIAAHQVLVETLLATLTNSKNAEELMENWQRISAYFDMLFSTEESIDQLDKCIVKIASLGLLSEGKTAKSLDLKTILRIASQEKDLLLANGEIKLEKITELAISSPFEQLPSGWVICKLNDVTSCLDHKRVPVKKSDRTQGKIPYYGANGPVGFIGDKLFNEELVLVVEDETFIGRTKPFSYRISGPSWVNNHAHVLKCTSVILPDFLNILLSYYPLVPLTSGTTGRKKLTKNTLLQLPIILPSIDQQRYIIKKVNELKDICEQLKTHLRICKTTQLQLSDAIVERVL